MHIFSGGSSGILALLLCGALLYGCATVPPVNAVLDQTAAVPAAVVGPHGPLSAAETRTILDRLQQQAGGSDLLARHLAVEQALVTAPLVTGNRTQLLHDGPETFRAMFEAIRAAKRYVFLEYYIFEDVAIDGTKLGELLAQKRRQGVEVAIIYDGYGSVDTPEAFFDQLRQAGVALLEFHPLNPLNARTGYAPNNRDHRKILIADGNTAIIGGVNLYTVYQPHRHNRLVASSGGDPNQWRDLDLEIEGPAARQLQRVFLDHWTAEQGPPLPPLDDGRAARGRGHEIVRIIGSNYEDTIPRYDATVLSAIRSAAKTVWLTTAYFVPTQDEMHDLEAAARRGVDVRLMLPGKSDSQLVLAVGHSDYGELLKAGVKIFELQDGLLHSKYAVIDGVWSTVGSSNLDHRSILFNDEVDAIVLGRDTGRQLEAQFKHDEAAARPVTLEEWEDRPFGERIKEFYSRFIENLL